DLHFGARYMSIEVMRERLQILAALYSSVMKADKTQIIFSGYFFVSCTIRNFPAIVHFFNTPFFINIVDFRIWQQLLLFKCYIHIIIVSEVTWYRLSRIFYYNSPAIDDS